MLVSIIVWLLLGVLAKTRIWIAALLLNFELFGNIGCTLFEVSILSVLITVIT